MINHVFMSLSFVCQSNSVLFFSPSAGFAVFWDFVLGLSSSFSRCRLAAGIYQGVEIVTDVKLLPLVRTTLITKDSYPSVPPGAAGIINVKHPFPR